MSTKLIDNLSHIDKAAIDSLGIPGLLLMESAGRAVAEAVMDVIQEEELVDPIVAIVCGKGNNGGDGYVCARHLAMLGVDALYVIHTSDSSELSGDARTNFDVLCHYPIHLIRTSDNDALELALSEADIVVDALFGSGLDRPLDEHHAALVNAINASDGIRIAVDLPSGIDSGTGNIMGSAVKADVTVTFATAKPGLFLGKGKECAGRVQIADIGIPAGLISGDESRVNLLTAEDVRFLLPQRGVDAHKYTMGVVAVVAGSYQYSGAAVMSAEATLRAGAGIVKLAIPKSVLTKVAIPPEIITTPVQETLKGSFSLDALDNVRPVIKDSQAVVFGPGITTDPSLRQLFDHLLPYFLEDYTGIVVLDADALNLLSAKQSAPRLNSRFILTPHIGECARLLGVDKHIILSDLVAATRKLADKYEAKVVLKSDTTIVTGESDDIWINITGNPGMATAGCGDILTGMIAGFAAQGLASDEAARLGVYLHGLSGDLAEDVLTQYCMTATDLLDYLPDAINSLLEE